MKPVPGLQGHGFAMRAHCKINALRGYTTTRIPTTHIRIHTALDTRRAIPNQSFSASATNLVLIIKHCICRSHRAVCHRCKWDIALGMPSDCQLHPMIILSALCNLPAPGCCAKLAALWKPTNWARARGWAPAASTLRYGHWCHSQLFTNGSLFTNWRDCATPLPEAVCLPIFWQS